MNIKKEQEQFIQLLNRPLSSSTQAYYKKYLGLFLEWMQSDKIRLRTLQYNDLLNFIQYCKKEDYSTDRLNRIINILQQYFTIKQKSKMLKHNPAIGLKIRGQKNKLPKDLLDRESLDKLYDEYPSDTLDDKRNKVILGLLIHQGLTTGDLKRLKPEHLQLDKGKIYLPPSHKETPRQMMNSRILELKASQILELKTYLEEIRPMLNDKPNDRLFISYKGYGTYYSINNIVNNMSKKIRKYAQHYRNVRQIRSSVIAEWLKEKDVRVVQYMAGHVRVTSTELYKAVRMEDLQKALEQFHPMK